MKRGMLAIQTIVIAVISLIVLIVVVFIFKNVLGDTASDYGDIRDKAVKEAEGDTCAGFISINEQCVVEGDQKEGWILDSNKKCKDITKMCYVKPNE